jgi:nucleoid DNA-binding protein
MNFHALLLEFLKINGRVTFRGFGTFHLKNTGAMVEEDGKSISPPGKEIVFDPHTQENEDQFSKFVSEGKKIYLEDAQTEIDEQISLWNTTLEKEKEVTLENVGSFYISEETLRFTGRRIENLSPDSYGLEEINLTQIKNTGTSSGSETDKNSYRFSSSIWWIILLLAGISALTYFGITQPENLFGMRSFQNILEEKAAPQKTNTFAIEKSLAAIQDSARSNTAKIDSLKTGSIKMNSLRADSINAAKFPVISAPQSNKNYSK